MYFLESHGMSLITRVSLVGTAALAIAGTAFGAGSENDALAQIAELKRELAELKTTNNDSWLTEQRAGEIRGIVQDVLADAETRTSLQDSGAMAGYNNGFFMSSADGNFKLEVGALLQVRFVMNDAKGYQPLVPNRDNKQNTEYGFENARTQLNFSGNVVDPSWTYRVRLAMSPYSTNSTTGNSTAGTATVDFGYVQKTMDNGFSFRLGQFRAPWMREMLVEDGMQLAVDRSVLSAYFGQGFSQGLGFGYAQENWKVDAYVGNGVFSGVTNGPGTGQNQGWSTNATNWSFSGRFEYLIKGNWDQFADESSFRGEDFGVMVGVAGLAQRYDNQAPIQNVASSGDKTYGFTADVTMDFGGANLSATFVWARQDFSAANVDNVSPYGFNVQGGYFVTDDIELFGRYDFIDYKTTSGPGGVANDTDEYSGVTLGANWYLAGHNAKLTVDWSMNLKSFGTNGNLTSYGWRTDGTSQAGGDGSNENNQWALRAQMQLMF
jgi:hypothetical protein